MDAPEIRLRESPRLEVEGSARLFLGAASSAREAPGIEARLLDLSASGMGLAAPATPAPGQAFAFELTLNGAAVEGRGVVVWSRRARPDRDDAANLGVRFSELDRGGAIAIATVLKRLPVDVRRPPAQLSGALPSRPPPPPAPAHTATAVAPMVIAAIDSPAAAMASAPVAAAPRAQTGVAASPSPAAVAPAAPAVVAVAVAVAGERDPAPTRRASEPATEAGSRHRSVASEEIGAPPAPRSQGFRLVWIAGAAAVATLLAVMVYRSLDGGAGSPPAGSAAAPASERRAPSEALPSADAESQPTEPSHSVAAGNDPAGPAVAVPIAAALDVESGGAPVSVPASEAMAPTAPPAAGATAADREPAAPPAIAAPRQEAASQDASPTAARARRLVAIQPSREDAGEVLVLRADGPFHRQDVFAALLGVDPPRYLLRLSGIERPWRPPDLEVASPLIERVRTGLHSTPRGPELHVVVDLPSRAVEHDWEIEGDLLRVRLRPRTP